ncbi:hypothetical protein ACWGOQ_0020540 [Aquimarina sp. M1]
MITVSWSTVKKNFKKRKGWITTGNTLFFSGILSFSNHPDWGIWCAAIGFLITAVSLLKK